MLLQNRNRWTVNFLKHKKLQPVIAQFADKVKFLLDDELRTNSQLVTDYLHYPHKQSPQPRDPEYKPQVEYSLKSNLQKAKLHIIALENKNRKRRQQEADLLALQEMED